VDHLTSLAVAARNGDVDALRRLIHELQGDVWRVCRYLGDEATADDLAQETFERMVRSIHHFRADGSVRSWALSIARHVCADATRQAVRRRRLRDAVRQQPVDDADASSDSTTEINELVDRLDPDRKAAFVLTQLVGLHYDEAAIVLGCPVGTIRSRVARARADLLEQLAATMGDAVPMRRRGRRSG
jgi:RNA polymerase sigma-70 factor (ECF subfamily)